MNLLLRRSWMTEACTLGTLFIQNGATALMECYTLEDLVRPEKIAGCTAIPAGTYTIVFTMSNRFKAVLPLLLNVPNFEGVRIHAGNTEENTEGCILVGRKLTLGYGKGGAFLGESRLALKALLGKMDQKGTHRIEIVEEWSTVGPPGE